MGVEAVEMDLQYGKLWNDTKLLSIEKSRDELFTSGKDGTSVYVILKQDVRVKFFDSNCVEMGVEAVEMDLQYGKL